MLFATYALFYILVTFVSLFDSVAADKPFFFIYKDKLILKMFMQNLDFLSISFCANWSLLAKCSKIPTT